MVHGTEKREGRGESHQDQKQQQNSKNLYKSVPDKKCAKNDLYKGFVVKREAGHFQLTLGWVQFKQDMRGRQE